MIPILDIESSNPVNPHTQKSFNRLLYALPFFCFSITIRWYIGNSLEQGIIIYTNYYDILFKILIVVPFIVALILGSIGFYYSVKSIRAREKNGFKKYAAFLGNGFFVLLLLLVLILVGIDTV